MVFTIWAIIILLFILSFIGVFVPVIPGVFSIWAGFLIYHFAIEDTTLTTFFWLAMALLTIVIIVADYVAGYYFVQRFGGSKWSQWGAIIGAVIGIFVYPPFGIILVPILLVFCIELVQKRTSKEAGLIAIGSFAGFLSGAFAKIGLQTIMILWFLIVVII